MLLLIREKQISHPTSQEQKEGLGNYGLVSEPGAGEVVELIVLKAVPKYLKDKTVIENSRHGFSKGRSHLTNLVAFCDEWLCR